MPATETAHEYYRTIDEAAYDELGSLLDEEFVHHRPDRTLEGRDRFVRFMRGERPLTDTTHALDGTYAGASGVAVHGRLLDAAGETLFEFIDAFTIEDGAITMIDTYTRTP